jgi:hypothetical protein
MVPDWVSAPWVAWVFQSANVTTDDTARKAAAKARRAIPFLGLVGKALQGERSARFLGVRVYEVIMTFPICALHQSKEVEEPQNGCFAGYLTRTL